MSRDADVPADCVRAGADDAEELARAEIYGLLAALFYAPPDAALHAQFQVAVTEAPVAGRVPGSELGRARRRGAPARRGGGSRASTTTLFQGVGKPEIFLYGSFYLAGKLNEKPLVDGAPQPAGARPGAARDDRARPRTTSPACAK